MCSERHPGILLILMICVAFGTWSIACDSSTPEDDDDTVDDITPDDDDTIDDVSDLCINEFQASNQSTIEDGTGAFPDWIELANLTDADIDLDGYSITDDLDTPDKHVFEAGLMVPAGGFLLLWADRDIEQGADHLPFALTKAGEQLGLYEPDGTAIDEMDYLPQVTDWSTAQFPDGSSSWDVDATPSPGVANGETNS